MSRVIEHLADLTGFRDRDVLDVSLVGALMDLLRPDEVGIHRVVGEDAQRCWLTRAIMKRGDTVARADPLWAEPGSLPLLDAFPARLACLHGEEAFELPGPPAVAYFPMATEWQAVGVLEITTSEPLTAEDLRLVSSILRIYRNFQGLLDYSERDTLTGLLNRKTFDESFMKAVAEPTLPPPEGDAEDRRTAAQRCRYWMGVIDIDHFKRVNDTYGHLIGDEVLLLLARLMRASFRFDDRLYRFGGEEFVVLMRCTDAPAAALALERLRVHVERHLFPQVGHITVSIGFTELKRGDTPSGAFERADKAVYFAKGQGRNQVRHHAELVASGHLEDDTKIGDVELF